MRTQPNMLAKIITSTHFPAAATAAVVTIAADAEQCWCIRRIALSYSAAPTGGRLTVVAGSTTLLDLHITDAGPMVLEFDQESVLNNNTKDEAVVVTLASGAGAVVGKLSVQYQ